MNSLKFIQICSEEDGLYGLDEEGRVWRYIWKDPYGNSGWELLTMKQL